MVGDTCVFIGGADRTPKAHDDVWVLRFERAAPLTARWTRKTTTTRGGEKLPARSGASATAVGTDVYVFGGQDPETGVCFNDVVVLDAKTWEWRRLPLAERGSPPPRTGHVACAARNGEVLVIHGGASPEVGPMGDVYVLNLQEGREKWERPRVEGQSPEPREMHAGVAFGNAENGFEEFLIIGGRGRDNAAFRDAHVLDLAAMRWTRRGDFGESVCAHAATRWRALGAPSESDGKKTLIPGACVFGGFDGTTLRKPNLAFTELQTLLTSPLPLVSAARNDETREMRRSNARAPGSRFAHACVTVDLDGAFPILVAFGGLTPAFDLADVAVWSDDEDLGKLPEPKEEGPVSASDLE